MYSADLQEIAATIIVVNESIKKKIDMTNFHLEKFIKLPVKRVDFEGQYSKLTSSARKMECYFYDDTYALSTIYFILTFGFVLRILFKNTKLKDRVPFRYSVSVLFAKTSYATHDRLGPEAE
jgi:hypothetical protein